MFDRDMDNLRKVTCRGLKDYRINAFSLLLILSLNVPLANELPLLVITRNQSRLLET